MQRLLYTSIQNWYARVHKMTVSLIDSKGIMVKQPEIFDKFLGRIVIPTSDRKRYDSDAERTSWFH